MYIFILVDKKLFRFDGCRNECGCFGKEWISCEMGNKVIKIYEGEGIRSRVI